MRLAFKWIRSSLPPLWASLSFASIPARAAAPQYVHVEYDIEPTLRSCPSLAEFREVVARQLGYDPDRAGASLVARVRVQSVEGGIEGALDWSHAPDAWVGERRFSSRAEDCQKLMATIGFVVAVQIQLMAADQAQAPTPTTSPSGAEPSAIPDALPNQAPAQSTSPSATLASLSIEHFEVRRPAVLDETQRSLSLGIGAALALGLGPEPMLLGRLFLAPRWKTIGFEVGAEASVPDSKRLPYGAGFRYAVELFSLAACSWHRSISACGQTKFGRMRIQGLGVDRPASPDGFVALVGPRLGYSLGLGDHLALLARLEALFLLTPWTVDLNHESVWNMPRLSLGAGIDVAVRFR